MLALVAAVCIPALLQCATAAATEFEEKCVAFKPETLIPGATRTALQYISAGSTLSFPDNDPTCNRASQFVPVHLCRVALRIDTFEKSNITFEAWLPSNWSGRFLATGNGGIDGCIKYEDIAYGTLNGFATVGANNGKNGTGGLPFYRNPETVIDYAWRSLHTSVTAGKTLAKELYEKPHNKSYYLGCSLGGRQGIASAERFPEDFDGIVAGAPAVDFNNLISWRASFFTITGAADSPDFISTDAWKTWIHDEVLKQCDNLDRFEDGIIEDPTLCKFDPSPLLCGQNSPTNCLSATQVEKVKKIFSDYKYPNGTLIYSGMQPGSEKNAIERLYAGKPFPPSEDWFKYVVYNDPNWNASKYTFTDAQAAESLNPANIRTFPSSLPAFQSRGGKLLIYHGQQDQQITSFNTNRFYENLRAHATNDSELESWARYFKIAGMNHCSSGPGAWVIGQGGGAASSGIPFERTKNVLRAVVDWVEQGFPPTRIEGTKFINDSVQLGVDFTRRHCRYPLRGFYAGGNWKSPNAWNCR